MKNIKNETGGVIIFVAGVIGVLLFMIGVVLDTGIATTSKTAYENTANMIALASLKSFSQSDKTTNSEKLNDAALEGQNLAQDNYDLWLGRSFMEDPNLPQNDLTLTGGANGNIIPGYWYHTKPLECNGGGGWRPQGMIQGWMDAASSCPCSFDKSSPGVDNDGWKGGCFIEVTSPDSPDSSITAMKVQLNTNQNSGIKHTISQIFSNSESFGITTEAIAAYIPRHILMAVDLSPSVAADTHSDTSVQDASVPGSPLNENVYGKFVYQLTPVDTAGAIKPSLPPWPFRHSGNTGGTPFTYHVEFGIPNYFPGDIPNTVGDSNYFEFIESRSFACLNEGYQVTANYDETNTPNPTSSYCDLEFFTAAPPRSQSDYELLNINSTDGDLDGNAAKQGMQNVSMLVDLNSGTQPEPLTSVINAVHSTLETIQARGFDSDRIGIVGFDDDILEIRSTVTSGQLSLLGAKDPEFQPWIDDTDIIANPRGYLDRFLIPRTFSGEAYHTNQMSPPYTESAMPTIMGKVLTMFDNAPDRANAQSMMFLFTDGLATCPEPEDPGEVLNMGSARDFTIGNSSDPSFNPYSQLDGYCNADSPQHNLLAIEDMVEMARDNFAPSNIAIHIFLFGSGTAPHTIPKGDGNGGILSDSILRTNSLLDQYSLADTMVNSEYYNTINNLLPGGFGGMSRALSATAGSDEANNLNRLNTEYQLKSSANPWYLPNHLYAAARYTRGYWVPVRPPCQAGVDITADIETKAANVPYNTPIASWDDGINGWGPAVTDPSNPSIQLFPTTIDQNGRLKCDPQGRDVNTLIGEEVEKIIEENPFVIVSEGSEVVPDYN